MMNELLLIGIRYLFLIIAFLTMVDLFRYRDQARLDIALMFGATAVVIVMLTIPKETNVSGLHGYVASLAVVAQPYLLLRLVNHFRDVGRKVHAFTFIGMILSGLILIFFLNPRPIALTLLATAYFVLVEGYAVLSFVLGALTTRGVTRWRLSLIAAGSTLFGITILLVTAILFMPELVDILTPVGVFFLTIAIICYYLGLSTPRRLQQAWQQAELHRFLAGTQRISQTARLTRTRELLCDSAVRAVGGVTAVIAHYNSHLQQWEPAATEPNSPVLPHTALIAAPLQLASQQQNPLLIETAALGISNNATQSTLLIPLVADEQEWGILLVFTRRTPLFVDNDLALLKLLADQAAFVLSYETVVVEQPKTVRQLRSLQDELERRVIERTSELSAANEELARTARAKDEFLANMSHELRTPLNAIMSLTEIIEEGVYGPINSKQNRALCTIKDSSQHLLSLINDILDVAKIEAGKLCLDLHSNSVQSICETSLAFVREIAVKKDITLHSHLDGELKVIVVDGRRLKQILVNLLSNAIKFTPSGGHVCLETIGNSSEGVAHFSVSDTGIGMAPADLARLFQSTRGPQAFVQLDSSLARQHEGTGLGLNLVYRLTELHNGSISVKSELNKGSRFTVSLPWQTEQDKASGRDKIGTGPLNHHHLSHGTILLAEDNDRNLRAYRDYLSHCGYQIVTARNGYEAIVRAGESDPDIILMDIQMPEMDGLTAIEKLRASQNQSNTPIIAITALAMPGDREKCLAAGANDYLSKPIRLRQLARVIQAHLGG